MISEQILSFLSKVPENFSEHASGIMLNIIFIVIIIFAIWGTGKLFDIFENEMDSTFVVAIFITSITAGIIFILALIIDILIALT
jgi:hypothetical protein